MRCKSLSLKGSGAVTGAGDPLCQQQCHSLQKPLKSQPGWFAGPSPAHPSPRPDGDEGFPFAGEEPSDIGWVPAWMGPAGSPVPKVVFEGLCSSPASPSELAPRAALLFTVALGMCCAARGFLSLHK